MKLIPFFLRYLRLYSSLFSTSIIIHYSSQTMSSITGFTELILPTTPKSTSPSVPDNTPNDAPDRPLTPQLAIHSIPIEEDKLSSIDYESVVEDPDSAPAGFINNELDSRHFYPIHVPNPQYGKWDHENRTQLAKYIQYNADYTYVTGTNGRGYSRHTIPVYISRQMLRYCRNVRPTWVKFNSKDTKESDSGSRF